MTKKVVKVVEPEILNGPPVSTVRVMGKKFKLVQQTAKESENLCGSMDIVKQKVTYNPRAEKEFVQDTVVHELIHAIDQTLYLKMTERQVHQLANGLIALFKDNPALAQWLIED